MKRSPIATTFDAPIHLAVSDAVMPGLISAETCRACASCGRMLALCCSLHLRTCRTLPYLLRYRCEMHTDPGQQPLLHLHRQSQQLMHTGAKACGIHVFGRRDSTSPRTGRKRARTQCHSPAEHRKILAWVSRFPSEEKARHCSCQVLVRLRIAKRQRKGVQRIHAVHQRRIRTPMASLAPQTSPSRSRAMRARFAS